MTVDPIQSDGLALGVLRHPASGAWFEAIDQAAFIAGWLDETRALVTGVQTLALFVVDDGADALRPVGLWPDGDSAALEALSDIVARAAARPGIARVRGPDGVLRQALAIRDNETVVAVAAIAALGPEAETARALRLSTGWVAARLWQRRGAQDRARFDRGFGALDLMATAAEQRGLKPAAMALVEELARWLPARRAAIGLLRRTGSTPKLMAISGNAWFRRNAPLARAVEDAMGEAVDQNETTAFPRPEARFAAIDTAHQALCTRTGSRAVVSTPLRDAEGCVGALLAEFETEPSEEDLLRLEAIAALAGPLLALKAREARWISGRMPHLIGRGLGALGAPHRPSYRLATLAILVALALPFFLKGALRLGADATLLGTEQRAAVAPVAGFIEQADIRPGDRVAEGDLLVALDDRDLQLETERLSGEIRRLRQEARLALSEDDASGRALTASRLEAAEAEFALAIAQLERMRIRAPVSGTVLSGDHRRRLGAPVEAGELLHEIAAGDGLQVELGIDERDLALVRPGMRGTLALASEPNLRLPLTVTAITPVAGEVEGRRLFTAEAELSGSVPDGLVPGLEGFARLEAGEQRLWTIWTRRLRGWLILQTWRWRP